MSAARKRSPLRQVERDAYLVSRAAGDIRALQSGGVTALLLRLGRRKVRRTVGRKTGGWL
jgi:hypothetical protein